MEVFILAIQIVNADPTVLNTLKVEVSKVLPRVLPTIAVGEVLPFNVRRNPQGGSGLLYFQGQLIPAKLPEDLEPGDKLKAHVTRQADQIVLKILDIQKPAPSTNTSQANPIANELASELLKLVKLSGSSGLSSLQAFSLPAQESVSPAIREALAPLLSSLNSFAELHNPEATPAQLIQAQLIQAGNGSLSDVLREGAQNLKTLAQAYATAEQFLLEIQKDLQSLSSLSTEEAFSSGLKSLVKKLSAGLKNINKDLPQREMLQQLLDNLGEALENPLEQRQLIQSALTRLASPVSIAEEIGGTKSLTSHSELSQLANRFEQIAGTLETLNKLNPLMQALGEPALILFPFFFQGLLAHGEVTVDPAYTSTINKDGKNGEKGQRKSEKYRQIRVSVPLPHLGQIDVQVAYREKEILVRLNLQDKEAASFIEEHLGELATILRDQGYEKAEFTTVSEEPGENLPAWSVGLHPDRSVIA